MACPSYVSKSRKSYIGLIRGRNITPKNTDSGKIVYTGTIVFTEIKHWTIHSFRCSQFSFQARGKVMGVKRSKILCQIRFWQFKLTFS